MSNGFVRLVTPRVYDDWRSKNKMRPKEYWFYEVSGVLQNCTKKFKVDRLIREHTKTK